MLALHPASLAVALLAAWLPDVDANHVDSTVARAREMVVRGQPADAVATLERLLPEVPEDQLGVVLESLRAAYEEAIRRADADGRTRDAALLRDNLAIISGPDGRGSGPARPPEPPRMPLSQPPAEVAAEPSDAPAEAEQAPAPAAPSPHQDSAAKSGGEPDLKAADAAFRAKKYEKAGTIYGALARDGRLPEVRRDPWAYCRMVTVVARINAAPPSPAEWEEIRTEIEAIRKLSPTNWYAEYLRSLTAELTARGSRKGDKPLVLRGASPEEEPPAQTSRASRVHRFVPPGPGPGPTEEPAPTAETATVGRPGAPIGNWKVWETRSFRILHADESLAQRVAQIAEASRAEQSRRWIGTPASNAWTPRCDIYVYPSAAQFSQMTGQPGDSPGFSTMGLNGGQVVARRINLRADHPNLLTAILPHEVTHVVLADVFREIQVPRWADEGMAVLSEPTSEQELRAADLKQPLAENRLFRLGDLMSMDYPDGRYWSLYYAQSVSLTRYLVERGSPEKFIEFVLGSQRSGIDAELRRVYGIKNVAELQARWLAHVQGRERSLAIAESGPGRDPARR